MDEDVNVRVAASTEHAFVSFSVGDFLLYLTDKNAQELGEALLAAAVVARKNIQARLPRSHG